ncbi:MAG: HupE/UreJ family protein [Betaproteobacteria bacterium]
MNNLYGTAILAAGLVLSNVVHAHFGDHSNASLEAGLLHPFSGLDHMLAMIAVGAWAAQAGGRALLAIPAAFMGAMVLGAALAVEGVVVPMAHMGIAGSVLVAGLLVALAVRSPLEWALPMIAMLAIFHGYAHGSEMPQFSSPGRYFAGFLMATAVLHSCGVAAAVALRGHMTALRAGGAVVSVTGFLLLLAA